MRVSKTPAFPSLSTLLAELAGAVLGGIVLAFAFGLGMSLLLASSDIGMGLLTAQVYAAIVGFGVGTGVGAALSGRLLGQRGSWWLAVLGSVLTGGLVAVVMRVFALGTLLGTLGVALCLMVVAAVLGYNLRRQ